MNGEQKKRKKKTSGKIDTEALGQGEKYLEKRLYKRHYPYIALDGRNGARTAVLGDAGKHFIHRGQVR